jgi:hypothetical protein
MLQTNITDALKAGKLTDEITDVIQSVARSFSKI